MKPDPLATASAPPSWTQLLAEGVVSHKPSKSHPIACQGAEITHSFSLPDRHTVRRRLNDVVYVTREHVERVMRRTFPYSAENALERLNAGERIAAWANEYWIEGSKS